MLAEIRAQPEVLARVGARVDGAVRRLASDARGRRLHFLGCGDMHFAARQTAALASELFGLDVRAWRSMDLRWSARHLGERDVVVCASVSGRTLRTLEAARLARDAGAAVAGITDNPGSPLDQELETCIVLGTAPPEVLASHAYAGYRHQIAQTQSFAAVWAVELALCAAVAGTELDVAALFEGPLAGLDGALARLAPELFAGGAGGCDLVFLGSGPHLPMARYGAAKMLEFGLPAQAQCLEEWNHLEAFVSGERTRAVLLAGDEPSFARAAELVGPWSDLGVQSLVLAPPGAPAPAPARMLELPAGDLLGVLAAECLAVQLLAAHGVAALGCDPDRWLGGLDPDRAARVQAHSAAAIRASTLWTPRA